MSTTTAQRRKQPKAPESLSLETPIVEPPSNEKTAAAVVVKATVRRRKFGTGPFDEHWLNVDCCGLTCALITYGLHLYAVYTVCFIMIPPWMSSKDDDGIRQLTAAGHFHRAAFTIIAGLACLAHFKAMVTNPGAVPPDAKPVPSPEEMEAAAAAAAAAATEGGGGGKDNNKALLGDQKKGMRLCRRCNAFKPRRAHHCSVCRRCIIKMDRTLICCICRDICSLMGRFLIYRLFLTIFIPLYFFNCTVLGIPT